MSGMRITLQRLGTPTEGTGVEGAAAVMSGSQHSGSGWVRVAMAYLLRSNKRSEWGDHPV